VWRGTRCVAASVSTPGTAGRWGGSRPVGRTVYQNYPSAMDCVRKDPLLVVRVLAGQTTRALCSKHARINVCLTTSPHVVESVL